MPLGAARFTLQSGGISEFDLEYLVIAGAGGGAGV